MRLYRDSFRPSPSHDKPYAILATHVICADTDEEAERLASTVELNFVRRAKANTCRSPRPKKRSPMTTRRPTTRASRRTARACRWVPPRR